MLGSEPARRLTPDQWAQVETQLAAQIDQYTPSQLVDRGTRLVGLLDQDGPEPDDTSNATVTGPGHDLGPVRRCRDRRPCPAPVRGGRERPTPQRQAEALADLCGFVLDHGDLPRTAGRRPHGNVVIRLEDLENRARAACLDFGGTLSPESVRMLCCDAAVIPVVMDGKGQPLDVGRVTRVVPEGIRRAVTVRDGGCARCGKPPSWCEIHHILEWENGGPTSVENCVMLCRICHRSIHHAGWNVKVTDGIPEFYPPPWIDYLQRPRRRPPHLLAG